MKDHSVIKRIIMRKVLFVVFIGSFFFISCNTGSMDNEVSKSNPFIGTWEAEIGNSYAVITFAFTENKFTKTYKWLENSNVEESMCEYSYDNRYIVFHTFNAVDEIYYPSQAGYRFIDSNTVFFEGATFKKIMNN